MMIQVLFLCCLVGICSTAAFFLVKAPMRQFCSYERCSRSLGSNIKSRLQYTPLIKLGVDLIPSAAPIPQENSAAYETPLASIKVILARLLTVDGEMKKINNSLQTNSTMDGGQNFVGGH